MFKRKGIFLILSIILIFVIGVWLELDYRILTRRTVKHFANYKLGFYGGKDFRIFETDIAFILTLIPISFYVITLKKTSIKMRLKLNIFYLIFISVFYCFYCFLESHFIKITITTPIMNEGFFKYHQSNVNYRLILFLTIISTFIFGLVFKRILEKH